MTFAVIKPSLNAGELAPSLYGRIDLQKWSAGLATCRNAFVSYRGGINSRAGTAWVGKTLQEGADLPPRNIKFQFNINQGYTLEFGQEYMRVVSDGGYVVETAKVITGITQTDPAVVTSAAHGFNNDDWVFIQSVVGMTEINGQTYIVANKTVNTFEVLDVFGDPVDAAVYSAYVSGGTASRLFTLATPYQSEDLPWLKSTQSADVMTICCLNQDTGTEYDPMELARIAADNWTLSTITYAAGISPPAGTPTAVASVTTASNATTYQYVVTAVDEDTGAESVASNIAQVTNSVNIGQTAGTITVSWTAVTNAEYYNVYKTTPAYNTTIPVGVIFGYAGFATGVSWLDTNIIQDFSKTPPLHEDPFTGAGNQPGVVAYFQQRIVYAATLNNPDTYFMSQPGLYHNMDSSIIPIDTDAIVGTPWAQQVNGIQFMVPMPGGLVVFTGAGAWQVNGGGPDAAITPATQNAQPQAYNGCSPTVPPIPINYDILHVQSKGSIVRDIAYQLLQNIYTGTDLTVLSNHLFQGKQVVQWAWAEEPYKLVWVIRNDGVMLALTFLKEQEVYGWSRHDTNGQFVSVCSVTEPPVDAVYVVVRRYVRGQWVYYQERMDDRLWANAEQCFCVDSGLAYPLDYPAAVLTPAAASGTGVLFITDVNAFSAANIGDVIRVGGGKATVVSFSTPQAITADITEPITAVLPDDPDNRPLPQPEGDWSISTPTTVVTGLGHLEGKEVAILADGSVVNNQIVVNGSVTLPAPASQIVVGLPYVVQVQSLYTDLPAEPGTAQGKRKSLYAVTVIVENSRGFTLGANQPDQAAQPNQATVTWANMMEWKQRGQANPMGSALPLFTGLARVAIPSNWNTRGQVALEQRYPLPLNIMAMIPEAVVGDTNG